MTHPSQTEDAGAFGELEAAARAEVVLPAYAHVIGEPVTVTDIRSSGFERSGLLATCTRGGATYELSLADMVFPAASDGASFVRGVELSAALREEIAEHDWEVAGKP